MPAAGALVPHVKSRIGVIATQALINPFYGTEEPVCTENWIRLDARQRLGNAAT